MNRLIFLIFFLCGLSPVHAQQTGIDQDLNLVTTTAGKFIVWYGHAGRSYFVQISDPSDHLHKWQWAPIIESGNDEYISYEVDGTAEKGFFRLKYTDQVPGPGETLETADFDGDGISNIDEIAIYGTDPINADSDLDGMPDDWEIAHGLNPLDNGSEDPARGPNAPFGAQFSASPHASMLAAASPVTNLQAFQAGVQASPTATMDDKDGDLIPDAEDADPLSCAVNWRKSPKPAYVAIAVPGWDPETHSYPLHLNNDNAVLTGSAVYQNGQWLPVNGYFSPYGGRGPVMPYQFEVDGRLHTSHLGLCQIASMSDQGEIMGSGQILIDPVTELDSETGAQVNYNAGYTPTYALIWRTPQALPEIFGVPVEPPLNGMFQVSYGIIHRDGTVIIQKKRPETYWSINDWNLMRQPSSANGAAREISPLLLAPSITYPAIGGSFAFGCNVPDGQGGWTPQAWVWPANGTPRALYTLTTPAKGAPALDFQNYPTTIGTAPGGEACINLSGEVLVGHAGRYYQVSSLRGATQISPHGAALLPGTPGHPDIWYGGSTYALSTCVANPDTIGSTLRVVDMNDQGGILATADDNTANQRLVILLPVEVRDSDRALTSLSPDEDPWTNANLQKQIPDASIAWITGNTGPANAPEMPKLTAKTLGGSASINVRWRFECEYRRGNGYRQAYVSDFTRPEDKVGIPTRDASNYTEEMPASQEWKIYEHPIWTQELSENGFFGGLGKVFLKINDQSEIEVCRFRIGGRNPDEAIAKAYINSKAGSTYWYAYAVAKHETLGRVPGRFYNQFYTEYQPTGGRIGDTANDMGWAGWGKAWPLYNLDRSYSSANGYRQNGPGGYGMFQLTLGPKTPGGDQSSEGFITRAQIWNWQANCDRSITELQGKMNKAISLKNGLEGGNPTWPQVDAASYGRLGGRDASVLTYYNGMYGGELERVKVTNGRSLSCWKPVQSGTGANTTRTWRFLQNTNDYVQHVNSHIE